MASTLPPLTALRAFEAAARHASFRKAASELHVTPAAISHQLKALEDLLGVELFRRANRRVVPTPAARAAAARLREGFQAIMEAVDQLRASDRGHLLTVSAAPAFAGKWLMPRLHRFVTRHPEIDVRLSARMRSPDSGVQSRTVRLDVNNQSLDDADVAIRYGDGSFPGMRVDRLLELAVTPMASPQLARGPSPLREPDDLRHHALLHDDTAYFANGRPNWDNWLDAACVGGIDTTRGVHFSHANLAIDAAIDGLGVLLSLTALAEADIAAGRLVRPFALALPSDFAYFIVCPRSESERPAIRAFREWLLQEARSTQPGPAAS